MKQLSLVDVNLLDQNTAQILKLAMGSASSKRLAEVLELYKRDARYSLFECSFDGKRGIVGLELLSRGDSEDARILHIAVEQSCQRAGVGRMIIRTLIEELGYKTLRAETDSDAVGFYVSCGFEIESLGERYPGVERFECTLRTTG